MPQLRNTEQVRGSFEDVTNNKLDGLTQEVVSENLENLENKIDHMTSETVAKESQIIRQEPHSSPKKENQETTQTSSTSFPQRTSGSKGNKTILVPKREKPQSPIPQETSYPEQGPTEPHRLPRRNLPSITPPSDGAEGVDHPIRTGPESSHKKRTPTDPDQSTPPEQPHVKQEDYKQNTVPVLSSETTEKKEKEDTWIEIEEKQTSSFGKYRGRMMGKEQAGFTREQITPQQAQQAEKNKQTIRASTEKVAESLQKELPKEELHLIEESIIRYVRRDTWYRDEIRKIRSTGMKEGKSSQEINQNIEVYNTQVKKQLLPFFIMEMQAGNMVLKRSGRIVHLQEQTIKQLDANTEFTALKVVYEQFMRNPYFDLTNQNHLNWPQSSAANRLESELIKSVATNSELETFLFDHADTIRTSLHTKTKKSLINSKSPEILTHLQHLFGETTNETEEITPTAQMQLIEKFISRIDPYTKKRINQTIALNHCAVLNQCFGAYKSAGKSTIDEMQIDFDQLNIDTASLTFSQPITYQHLHTTLSLDGESGDVFLPNGLTHLFGGVHETRRIKSGTRPAKELQSILMQAAQITPKEIVACTSQKEIEQVITKKIENKIKKVTPQADKKQLNTVLEQEALLANRKHFFSAGKTGNEQQQLSFIKEGHATPLQQILTRRVYGNRSEGPFGIEQLRTINKICIDPKMEDLFAQSTRNNPHGIETFLERIGFFNRGPTMGNNDTVLFFTSLHNMATSGVPPQEESGYGTLTKLLKKYANGSNIPLGLSGSNAPYTYTTNHQIVPFSLT